MTSSLQAYRVVELHQEQLKIQCKVDDYEQWGAPALTKEQYQRKELLQRETPFSKGHSVFFALVDAAAVPDANLDDNVTMYCHCEAHCFDCLVQQNDGEIQKGFSYHIASVYTLPRFRGRGLARLFLLQVAKKLQLKPQALASVLYSDIGPKFYDELGWKLYASDAAVLELAVPANHRRLDLLSGDQISHEGDAGQRLFLDQALEDFLVADAKLIEKELQTNISYGSKQVFVPLATRQSVEWQFVIGTYYASLRDLEEPKQCGLKLADDAFVVWCHNFKESTLFIVRARFPSPDRVNETLCLLDSCLREAQKYQLKYVKVWSPPRNWEQQQLLQEQLHIEFTQRPDSLSSLMLFPKKPTADKGLHSVDQDPILWLCNEKFAWV